MEQQMTGYPRPQFVRRSWLNLNGPWDFAWDDADVGVEARWMEAFPAGQTIQAPFSYETARSGIGDEGIHRVVWYSRQVSLAGRRRGERVLLHFEGADYRTQVWVDGRYIGSHTGGYSRFTFDLTEAAGARQEVRVTVRVEDSLAEDQPRGKQRYRPESWGCWYVQTTGIWKTVWLEYVPEEYLVSVESEPDPEAGTLALLVETAIPEEEFGRHRYILEVEASFHGEAVCRVCKPLRTPVQAEQVEVCGESGGELFLWSPEEPNLYDVRYRLYRDGEAIDEVRSYVGFRSIAIRGAQILLNGKPLYLCMVLDQGYWKDSGLTPPDEQALVRDIDLARLYGYNGVRKHQKTEDERFLYWCDVKGMLVWSEMAACYAYNSSAALRFSEEWGRIVRQNKNHPSIITWVPFNESWGVPEVKQDLRQQSFVNSIYYLTKALDPTRPVITNDGWEHTLSDIITIHDYQERGETLWENHMDGRVLDNQKSFSFYGQLVFAQGYGYRGQPLLLSEYGGIAFRSAEGWGYGSQVEDEAEFLERFTSQNRAIHRMPQFTGFCYTQLTDVQQEVNGLVDMERRHKFSPEAVARIREINLSTFARTDPPDDEK